MDNKKISTGIGTIILLVIAITVGVLVWKWEKDKIEMQSPSVVNKQVSVSKNQDQSELNNSIVNNGGNISEGVIVNGWKKYTSNDKLFSIEYPNDWKINGSVFNDIKGEKVAEFLPGSIIFKPGQKCFDNLKESSARMKTISQTNVVINNHQGVLATFKVVQDPGGGTSYPNIYCIYEGSRAFIMAFYDHDLNSKNKELFYRVISTLNFE